MHLDEARSICLALPGATEDMPFGPSVITVRVGGKIFAFLGLEAIPSTISVKQTPDDAIAHRDRYDAIQGAYHLNKKHWSSVVLDGSVPDAVVTAMINASYALVRASLPAAVRTSLADVPTTPTVHRR